ncbi:hypothetical protein [Paraburkholderia sp. BR14320]|uniref:hypothetical protein n=1 Tax=unclassified Paraburkholderia TaxID=2615204 RepID=UPI0034CF405E
MDDSINDEFERTQKLVSVLGQARQLIASELRAGLANGARGFRVSRSRTSTR